MPELKPTNIKWYQENPEVVLDILGSNLDGLSDDLASKRLVDFGKNKLPDKAIISLWKIIWSQLFNPLIFILIAAGIASVLIGEAKDAVFILLVILINTGIGAYQEYNAEKSASNLQKLLKIKSKVKRAGKVKEIDAEELVPGDIVYLESGNKVPADLRLVEVAGLELDESLLTGESQSVRKHVERIPKETEVADRKNMAYAGATVISGRASGIIVATGLQTEVGKIALNVQEGESAKPPLILRMEKFTRNIANIVIVLSVILAIMLRLQGMDFGSIFFFVVALAVSAIPEGLPVSLTVALAVATRRMAKRNVIVRKLTSVESLGSCTVIASDKTGTLTVNQQTVKKIKLIDGQTFDVTGEGYNGDGEIHSISEHSVAVSYGHSSLLDKIIRVSLLANEASLKQSENSWEYHGDAMDVALLGMGYKMGNTATNVVKLSDRLDVIPYESERKFSGAFYQDRENIKLGVKGAVETILDFCQLSTSEKDKIMAEANQLALSGYRVLGFAEGLKETFAPKEFYPDTDIQNLEFLGLICFIDPLRAEAKEAIKKCKTAGIEVLMITGDHPATASNIALELGLKEKSRNVVTGKMLAETGDPKSPEFAELVASTSVFARVSPTQKLEIVDALIQKGEFVAVTGDGVNDAPALRRANIGVAMGSGTDVAKEVGAMIVVDDNFSSIVAGVEEGRFAYDNVRKVIYLLVSTGAAEVVMFILSILAGLPLPLLAVQLLWLNLVTNGIQDKALAFESGEKETMQKRPRKPSEGIFNRIMSQQLILSGLVIGLIAFGFWLYLKQYTDIEENAARNMVLLLMVCMQNIHIFNCRSEYKSTFKIPVNKNYLLILFVLAAQGIHILSMHIPFMQDILRIQPISLQQWLLILGLALPVLLVMELFKLTKRS
jgi:magnesium-transporting ATPase (P-type)